MNKRMYLAALIVFGTIFASSNLLYAVDNCVVDPNNLDSYAVCCANHEVSKPRDVANANSFINLLDTYENFPNIISTGDNKYLLCFAGKDDPISYDELGLKLENVNINMGKASEMTIYNLDLVTTANTKLTVGSNVNFINLRISGDSLSPLNVIGSNVNFINSDIISKQVGIVINGGQNVTIKGTKITGPGKDVEGSVGVSIVNAQNVVLADNPQGIISFKTGVDGVANIKTTAFQDVKIPINNEGPVVDMTKVGKKLNDNKDAVIGIVGVAPINLQNCESSFEIYDVWYSSYAGLKECVLKLADKPICIIPSGALPLEDDKKCPDNYIKIESNQCMFECSDINLIANHAVSFAYRYKDGSLSKLSDALELLLSGGYATLAPTMPISSGDAVGDNGGAGNSPAAGGEENAEEGEQQAGGGGVAVGSGDGGGGAVERVEIQGPGDSAPLGGGGSVGVKAGCSIAQAQPFSLAEALLLLTLLTVPVAVLVRVRKNKR